MTEEELVKDKINNQIEVDKEVLSVLPKNTKKNLQIYKDKAQEIKQEYNTFLNEIYSEIKRRYLKIKSIKPDEQIEKLSKEIDHLSKISLLDKNTTSFEKMELDKSLYILKRFYKNNLELINNAIVECLNKFNEVGVPLDKEDFNFSVYTKEYMTVLFEELKKGDVNSTRIKDLFEQIYWKCPDIIIHIELNFRSIYFKNEKIINRYFDEVKKQITKELGLDEEKTLERFNALQGKYIETKNKDTALIIDKFLNNVMFTKDYEENNIKKQYKKILGLDIEELDSEKLDEINKNIFRLQNSLYELKNYFKFKFIYDEAIDIYKSNEKYKSTYNTKMKQIKKIESNLIKVNKKIERLENHKGLIQKLFFKNGKRLEKITNNTNAQIIELKNTYRDLEENKIKNIISVSLNDNSTIYDVLLLASRFYSFLVNTIIDTFPDIVQDDIQDLVEKFKGFISYPKMTIINNIKISEDKDILLMVKDKYNLCNINISKEDIEEDKISDLISTVNILCENNYIINSNVTKQDIQFATLAKKIVETDNNA